MDMEMRIAQSLNKRVVIVGGGFGGLKLARELAKSDFQVVLIDQNNFHQFQPLFYQVATCGLESSSIVFPFRKIFHGAKNINIRLTRVIKVFTEEKYLETTLGKVDFDHLVIATGAGNNYFGNKNIQEKAYPMKSLAQSLRLRNTILERFEEALSVPFEQQGEYLTFVIAGGGPTGTELAGSLAEMRNEILPKDFPELDFSKMKIILIDGGKRVLAAMSERSSEQAHHYLKELGVEIKLATLVKDYDGNVVSLADGSEIYTKTMIWSAGIKGNMLSGFDDELIVPGNRIKVDEYNRVLGFDSIYAIGDISCMISEEFPRGHPQMAQPAIQMGKNVAKNLKASLKGKKQMPFKYKNLGSMATVGKNKAVVELPGKQFGGFFAWATWMFVHLKSILGVKNKFIVFLNWVWNYFTYNSSLRLIIKRREIKD